MSATSELQTINGHRTVITTLDQTHVALYKDSDGLIHIEIQEESDADCVITVNTFGVDVDEDFIVQPWNKRQPVAPPLTISDLAFDTIIDSAGYGIAYWADSSGYNSELGIYTITGDEHPTEDAELILNLTRQEIVDAFWKIADRDQDLVGPGVAGYARDAVRDGKANGDGDIEAGHVDSDFADCIIQVAAFGKIIYG